MDNGQPEHHDPNNNYQTQPQSPPLQAPLPAPTVIPTTPKKRFAPQTLIITILSVLLLATAGVLAYVLMSNRSETKSVAQTDESSKQMDAVDEVKEAAPPVKDEYAGWKTFPQDAQSLFWQPTDLSSAFSFTNQIKTEFRFPDGWKQVPIAGDATCRLVMGRLTENPFASAAGPVDTNGGTMCIGAENYGQGQTVDAKVASLVANGDFVIEEETTVGGVKAITIARTKNIPPDAGGKIFYTYVQNVRTTGNGGNVGTIVGCAPSGEANEREAFMIDCTKAIDSIKFL